MASDEHLSTIRKRARFNVKRVNNMMSLYEHLVGMQTDSKSGKVAYVEDILRAAVMFLHATLEDTLRELLKWRLPDADAGRLASIHFRIPDPGKIKPKKSQSIDLKTLTELHKDKTVADVIKETIEAHLDEHTFSDRQAVSTALENLSLTPKDFAGDLNAYESAFERRHLIVHQTDRIPREGGKVGKPGDIDEAEVRAWANAVDNFVNSVIDAIETPVIVLRKKAKGSKSRV
jgi:hypothetical protein